MQCICTVLLKTGISNQIALLIIIEFSLNWFLFYVNNLTSAVVTLFFKEKIEAICNSALSLGFTVVVITLLVSIIKDQNSGIAND